MKVAKLVVHPYAARQIALSRGGDSSRAVLENIESAIGCDNSFIVLDGVDPRKLSDRLKEYDYVEIYGARHGFCLTVADICLTLIGIEHGYAPNGFF